MTTISTNHHHHHRSDYSHKSHRESSLDHEGSVRGCTSGKGAKIGHIIVNRDKPILLLLLNPKTEFIARKPAFPINASPFWSKSPLTILFSVRFLLLLIPTMVVSRGTSNQILVGNGAKQSILQALLAICSQGMRCTRAVFPSVVGAIDQMEVDDIASVEKNFGSGGEALNNAKNPNSDKTKAKQKLYVGSQALGFCLDHMESSQVLLPLKDGIVADWELVDSIWDHAFSNNGERENLDEEDRKCIRQASDFLQEKKWAVKEGS